MRIREGIYNIDVVDVSDGTDWYISAGVATIAHASKPRDGSRGTWRASAGFRQISHILTRVAATAATKNDII